MKIFKRLFITLIAVLMVLTYAPTKALADDVFWVVKYDNNGVLYAESTDTQPSGTYYASEEEAVAAYQSGAQATITYGGQTTYYVNAIPALSHVNTYTGSDSADDVVLKLFADVDFETGDYQYTFSVPMTLDLNGHKVAMGQYGKKSYTYKIQKDFVLKDTSVGETGVLYGINNIAAILVGTSSAGSTFTLESGTIKSETAIFDTYNNCTINVTGGHMVSYSKYGSGDSRGIVAKLSSGCALNISGGEFRSDQSAKSFDTMSFDPMGYPTKNVNANSTISVTGGTFSGQAIQKYVPGYTADQSFTNENPTITVGDYNITRTTVSSPYGAAAYDVYLYTVAPVPVNYVAQIGETQYESFDEAVAAAQAGDTIELLDDITFGTDRSVPVWGGNGEQPFNIDLNGHTFQTDSEVSIDASNNGYKASAFCFAFDNEANITVSDGDIKTAYGAGIYVSGENVNLTLDNVNIAQNYPQNVQTTNEYSSAVRITYEGSVVINGGEYSGKNSIAVSNSGGKVVINDGTFNNDIFFSSYTSKSYYDNSRDAVKSITINGGTFLGNFVNPDKGELVIKGGTFTVDPTAYVAEGYKVTEAGGVYTVSEVNYVAQIGETQYETLAAAINVANADTSSNAITIKLLADLDFSDDEYKAYKWSGSNVNPLAITRSNVTLDLNGKTISNMGNCALGVGSIYAKDGTITNVTIKNGTLLAGKTDNVTNSYVLLIGGTNNCLIDSVTTLGGVNNCNNSNVVIKDSTIRGTKYYTVCAQTGANVTIRGTSYTKNTDQTVQTKAMFWVQGAGTDEDLITSSNPTGAFNASIITIESGYFNVDSNGAFYLGGGLAPTLTGGYYNIDPAAYVADGYAVESVSEEYEDVTYTYHVTTKKVAQIGNVQYETLAAAINAANQAENGVKTTIVLINDEAFDYTTGGMTINAGKVVEIDLNGHQVVGTANSGTTSAFINNYGSLTILDSTDVDEDGADCGRLATGANPSWVWDGSDSYSGSYASNLINNLGTVVVKSGLLQNLSSGSAAYVVDNNSTSYDVSLTVTGGKLLATKSSVRQFANSKTHTNALTVTGGTIQGGRFGVVVHEYGQLAMNLSGGTITTTDTDNYAVNVWTTSSTDTQYANINVSGDVVIDGYLYLTDLGRKSSTGTPATVSISGGYIEGLVFYGNTDGLEGSVTGGHYALNSVTDEEVTYLLSEQCIADGYEVAENQGADAEEYPYIVQEAVTYVAQIGNVKYETLAAAVAAATDGDTIVLIDNLTISSYVMVKKDITLDLNGHTIEVNGGTYGLISSRYNLVITDSSTNGDGKIYSTAKEAVLVQNGGTLTVNGGTIEVAYHATSGKDGYAIYVLSGSATVNAGNIVAGSGDTCIYARNASEVEINGGTVTSASWGIVMIDTSILTVNDGTVTGNTYAISTNGTSGQNAQIIITGGTIGNENSGAGIYLPSGSLDVSGGTITGKTGIYFKSTNLNITGGEIVGVGPAVEYNYSGNGSNSTGDALVIDSCGYPNGIDDVSISGGHFVSANAAAVKVYTYQDNEPVEKFITGGVFNTMPEEEYVAEGYKAVEYNNNYQVGPVSYEAETNGTIEGDVVPEEVTYTVNTIVKEDDSANAQEMDRTTDLSVTVSANVVENDTKAVASLGNIKDDATLKAIVEKAVEAASSAIDANTTSATIEITVAKGAADVVNNKVTYEVHPEALIKVDDVEVASVKIENEDLNGTFTFKLYAGNITQSGKYVKVTHIHSDNTSEDLGELLVDADGYVTVTGVESFSDFTLEVVETEVSAYAKFGYTISLEESINIIFNVKDLTDDLNTYTVEYIDPSTGEIVEKVPTNATLNSYVIAKCAAKQMGDVFTVVVKHNGTQINQTTDFSIKNYCDTIINGNFSTYIKDLCKATLDYGRYAQEEFDYNESELVNGGNDYFDNSAINVPDYAGQVVSNTFGSELKVSFSLTTESQTILNIYLTGVEANSYSVLVNGEETMFTSLGSDKIQVSITDIKAKDLGEKITIQVNDAGSTHELVYKVSPVDYMGFAVGHNSQVSINRAFYNYYLKAVDYFNNK